MKLLSKAAALLHGASPQELKEMTPAERARFADLLRHWWQAAQREQHPLNPNAGEHAGVLADLRRGQRSE